MVITFNPNRARRAFVTLDISDLQLYAHLLAQRKYHKLIDSWRIIELDEFLPNILQKWPEILLEANISRIIIEIIKHTIISSDNEKTLQTCFKFLNDSMQTVEELEPYGIILHLIYQILLTLSQTHQLLLIATEPPELEKIEKYIQKALLSDIKEIFTAAAACLNVLLEKFKNQRILKNLWMDALNSKGSERYLDILCHIADYSENILQDINGKKLQKLLWQHLESSDATNKKLAVYVLKKTIHVLKSSKLAKQGEIFEIFQPNDNWPAFFTIYDNFRENQSHLIMPSLEILDQIDNGFLWKKLLIAEGLKHYNKLALNWMVNYVLTGWKISDLDAELFNILMIALNNTFLYSDVYDFNERSYCDFVKSDPMRFICEITKLKASVPLLIGFKNWSKIIRIENLKRNQMEEQFNFKLLLEIASIIRDVKNSAIQFELQRIFFECFEDDMNYFMSIEELWKLKATLKVNVAVFNQILPAKRRSALVIEYLQRQEDRSIAISGKIFEFLSDEIDVTKLLSIFKKYVFNQKIPLVEVSKAIDVLHNEIKDSIIQAFITDYLKIETTNPVFAYNNKTIDNTIRYVILFLLLGIENSNLGEPFIDVCFEFICEEFPKLEKCQQLQLDYRQMNSDFADRTLDKLSLIGDKSFIVRAEKILEMGSTKSVEFFMRGIRKLQLPISNELLNYFTTELKNNNCTKCVSDSILYLYEMDTDIQEVIRYTASLLKSDTSNINLAQNIFSKLPFGMFCDGNLQPISEGISLLMDGIIYGEPLIGVQKIEFDHVCTFARKCDEPLYHAFAVRLECYKIVYKNIFGYLLKNSPVKGMEFLNYLKEGTLLAALHVNQKKSRYFKNSKQHRVKLRLLQFLAILQKLNNSWDERFLEMLCTECNQNDVKLIIELVIANSISKERLECILKSLSSYPPSSYPSIFGIAFMFCKRTDDTEFAKLIIDCVAPWEKGQYFQVRLYAQITIFKLCDLLKTEERYRRKNFEIAALIKGLPGQNEQENLNSHRFNEDFRYNKIESGCNLLNIVDILFHIPRLSDISSDEIWYAYEEDVIALFDENPILADVRHSWLSKSVEAHQADKKEGPIVTHIQRKMNLTHEFDLRFSQRKRENECHPGELIVVASLITKLTNLGGIARTCEVLGIQNLVLNSLKYADTMEFQTLSMTAERWLTLTEIKSTDLKDYIFGKKSDGYSIVGAEQTSNSVCFTNFRFPKKTVLILGHEKEGIPANLISCLDWTVEIPQSGMVRSLNVHVTGALFMWEYYKQHLS